MRTFIFLLIGFLAISCGKKQEMIIMQDRKSGSLKACDKSGVSMIIYKDPMYSEVAADWHNGSIENYYRSFGVGEHFWIKSSSGIVEIEIKSINSNDRLIKLKELRISGSVEKSAVNETPIELDAGMQLRWSFTDADHIYIYYDDVMDGKVDFEIGEKTKDDIIVYRRHAFSECK